MTNSIQKTPSSFAVLLTKKQSLNKDYLINKIQTGAKYKIRRSKNGYPPPPLPLPRGKTAGQIWLKIEMEIARGIYLTCL
jgi:hypothetical protein